MSESLDWTLELVDELSGPASDMLDAVSELQKDLGAVDKAASGFAKGALGDIGAKMGEFGDAVAEAFAGDPEALFKMAGEAAQELVGEVVNLAKEFFSFGEEVGEATMKMRFSFDHLTGGAAEGEAALKRVGAMADEFGMNSEEAAAKYRGLLTQLKGNQGLADNVMKAGADLSAVTGNKGAGDQLGSLIAKLQAKGGKMDARQLVSMQNLGVNPDAVIKAIAKIKGVSDAAAKKMLNAGQISATDSTNAILSAIQQTADKGGALGAAGAELAKNSIDAQKTRMANNFRGLFEGIDTSGIAHSFGKIADMISPSSPTGKRIAMLFQDVFGKVSKMLESIASNPALPVMLEKVVTFGEKAWNWIQQLIEEITVFGKALWKQVGPSLEKLGKLFEKAFGSSTSKNSKSLIKTVSMLGTGLGMLISGGIEFTTMMWNLGDAILHPIDTITQMTQGAVPAIENAFQGVLDFFGGLPDQAVTIAENFISGLINGITSGASGVADSVANMGQGMLDSITSVLGIHSPSREMHKLGEHTAAGFDNGMSAGGLDGSPVDVPKVVGAGTGGGGGASKGGDVSVSVEINVSGASGDPEAIAEAVSHSTRSEIMSLFDQMALEGGVAA